MRRSATNAPLSRAVQSPKTQSQDATTFSADYADAPEPPAKLADMGISKTQSSRWQQLSTVPDEQFEAALNDRYAPLTTARLITLAPGYQPPEEPLPIPPPLVGKSMSTIKLMAFFAEFARGNEAERNSGRDTRSSRGCAHQSQRQCVC